MAVLLFRVVPGLFFLLYLILLAVQGARWSVCARILTCSGWRDRVACGLFALGHVPAALYFSGRTLDPFYVHVPVVLRMGGLALYMLGMVLLLWAYVTLGRNWSPLLEIRKGHTLTTFGPYRYVRHPMYIALGGIGLGMLVLSANALVGPAFLITYVFRVFRVGAEEDMLRDHFGGDFQAYVGRTDRFVPRVVSRIAGRRWARATAAMVLAALLLGCGAIVRAGLSDEIQKADVAVVLGCRVYTNGEPGHSLKSRLNATVRLYRQGWFPEIVVSGGMGRNNQDEATIMRRYLVAHGVPAERIHTDSEGVNTRATALHAAEFLRRRGLKSAMVITQFYHVPRAQMALREAGVKTVYGAHARYFSWHDAYAVPRELAAILWYRLREAVA
ncbi:MAG: ElyC/SanA/YdcF family protein [FCB group bacterium]|jgi:protein-S-isoprenylcysteine O-methyltransferase Ste14/vancomycin permeability regulator SanA|nr:ElyC/SanA/YdcF family protein [FCB group bacterium]